MGNAVSSWCGPKVKTLDDEHELATPRNGHTLPFHGIKSANTILPVLASNPLECPESLKGEVFEEEFRNFKDDLKAKVIEYQDAIQPHTDEGGEAYYIGDAYEKVTARWAAEWAVENAGPYLRHIKKLSQWKTWHHLEYLAHWMEVTAAPPKWKFLRKGPGLQSREERAMRTKVCRVDFTNGAPPDHKVFDDSKKLKNALQQSPQSSEHIHTRLLIVEDLSRDVVEMLGEFYDVDPLFFLSHINDYLFHNTRDRWVELPNLDIDARNRSHFTLQYLRPRYFEDEDSFKKAERESGMFNVLRRLDSDRSRLKLQNGLLDRAGASVTLIRAKTSVWIKPRSAGEPVTAILLVDPTVKTGHPLWRGNRPFQDTPSMQAVKDDPSVSDGLEHGSSLFDEVVHWTRKLTPTDLESIHADPKWIAMPVLKLVIAEWLTVAKYMTARLGLIEWEMEKPHWGAEPKQMDDLMKKLAPWRRNIGYYQAMVNDAIARLFPHIPQTPFDSAMQIPSPVCPETSSSMLSLWPDFKIVKQHMTDCHARIMSIQTTATNAINIEESRRAIDQNKNALQQNKELARLTFLATIFIPLNFTSSFLSMSPDFFNATKTVWLFFVLGFPITLTALIVVDLNRGEANASICKRLWTKLSPGPKEDEPTAVDPMPANLGRNSTIPWPPTRNPSSFLRQRGLA
ncbi:uncharacterized protein RCC_01890 [Ramularia collo-cygni]|uniref:Uncharacterized protein n=1 Tax=Ramularia collo-cygni TaxID=112498 RepID=A0A2D3UTC6_9PEZI|nr:uncharacterized protein RCC_01890 [Ramularia collo-cygni]CZT16050.1 uncharacterized protein RCC_01890 [Ramularia collo-cygni]